MTPQVTWVRGRGRGGSAQRIRATAPLGGRPGRGWESLENAAVALVQAANLMELPRLCQNREDDPARNGMPAPVERDDSTQ